MYSYPALAILLPESNIVSGSWDKTGKIWSQSESPYELIATLYGHIF
jgi:hypothetical protein